MSLSWPRWRGKPGGDRRLKRRLRRQKEGSNKKKLKKG